MKLGFGLYRHQLTAENFRFARQMGATHLVVHLVDYFNKGTDNPRITQPVGGSGGWGYAGDPDKLWTYEELRDLKRSVNEAGLVLEAIENLDPAHWHDVLLDGPDKARHIENVKRIVRNLGKAGIPVLGYNFSLTGVSGRISGPFARGGAESVGMEGIDETPIPNGMVWNMIYDDRAQEGAMPPVSHEELWRRVEYFLRELVPVAEECGVRLAAHPDDPPVSMVRGAPKLVYKPDLYQRLLDIIPSSANALEFCLGTIAEMADGDLYEATDRYSAQGRLAYVHFRNIRGKAPHYRETFLDDGDIDMLRVLGILKKNGFNGVLIPDHTPLLECGAPWHAGMAYAMGFMQAALKIIKS